MNLVRTVAPAYEPLSLAEVKEYLRISNDDQDWALTGMIRAAREWVENETRRAIMPQTWKAYLDDWPVNDCELLIAPLLAVASLTYKDEAGATTTLSTDIYGYETFFTVGSGEDKPPAGRVYLKPSQSWPSATLWSQAAIVITFTAGYQLGNATEAVQQAAVPETLKHAMKLWLSSAYDNRSITEIMTQARAVSAAA